MPNTPAANQQGANGNSPSMRRNQPSIARFSPPRGRDVDLPSVNSLQRGPTTRSHAPLTNRQSSMKSGIESPPSTPISPAAKELARESAIDILEQIHASGDSLATFHEQKAELRKNLESAVGRFACNDIMQRLEATTHNPQDSKLFKDTAQGAMNSVKNAKDDYAVPFANEEERQILDSAKTTATLNNDNAKKAHDAAMNALNEARKGSDQTKILDAERAEKDARGAKIEAKAAFDEAKAAHEKFIQQFKPTGW